MALENFATSRALSMGIELELQLLDCDDYDLVGASDDLLRAMRRTRPALDVKPEMTMSMIELATGICTDHDDALAQLVDIRDALGAAAARLNIGICGGGTHAFQHWGERRIVDQPRFHHLSDLYGYLAKQFTVFGQHVHIGCPSADEGLRLLHNLSRYVPHFIALSASSPFVQGEDTGFESARLNSVFAFPLSGRAPFVETWADFTDFFDKMTATGVVKNMKDFYWDIRPKPEYGTIEVRVMDTPLTVARAAQLAAYIQCVARYLMLEHPLHACEDDYLVYTFNRFQACRFGYKGTFVDPRSREHRSIGEDILETMTRIEQHAIALHADSAVAALRRDVLAVRNDAALLRQWFAQTRSLAQVQQRQSDLWLA